MLRRLRELRGDDRGTTLLELVVGMTVLAAFMGMFSGAMILMGSTVNKVQAMTVASGQLNSAFLQLDKTIRYATGISTPQQSGAAGDWNVEFSDSTGGGPTVCTQLRIDAGQLQRRTWTVGSDGTSYSGLTTWTPLAGFVTNGAAKPGSPDQPFAMVVTANSNYQRLTVTIVTSGGTSTPATSRNAMTFTALNSSATAATVPCQQVAVDATT